MNIFFSKIKVFKLFFIFLSFIFISLPLCGCKDDGSNNNNTPPPVVQKQKTNDPLDREHIYENYEQFNGIDKASGYYGSDLSKALNEGDYSQVRYLYTAQYLAKEAFVPELMQDLKSASVFKMRKLTKATGDELKAFWTPWLIRFYGEAGFYRELSKWNGRTASFENKHQVKYVYDENMQKAADLGDAEACWLYGAQDFMDNGGYVKNPIKGWPYVLKAAELGWPIAQFEVGRAYATGGFVPLDYEKMVKFYKAAAEQGMDMAAANLGAAYEVGKGAPLNLKEAFKYSLLGDKLGGFFSRGPEIQKQLSEKEQNEALQEANAIINDIRLRREKEAKDMQDRWNALVPEIKKDIHKRIPWLVWTMRPDTEKEKARAEFLAKQAAMGNTRANATISNVENATLSNATGQ